MSKYPLVSVVVVTYNSEKYVIETLESVKVQTYQNIELIITDDHSSDNTLNICEKWLENNKRRFVSLRIISSDVNTGITINRNRGCLSAQGEWIKHIDGDDKLLPSCIADYIEFVTNNPYKNIVFSPLHLFGEGDLERWKKLLYSNFEYAFSLNKRDFRILLCKVCLFPAPSAFINTTFFNSVGGYDESIEWLEDWPFWVRSAFNGAHFAYITKPEVDYRISSSSLSQGIGGTDSRFSEAIRLTEWKTLGYMKKISWLYLIDGFLVYKNKYESNWLWKFASYLRPLNPFFWKARKLYLNYMNKR